MSHIFVSHVEEDADVALGIALGLEQAGFSTWCYELDSVAGVSYLLQTKQAIERSGAVVVVISAHSLGSSQMTKEVVRAHESGKHFAPVLRGIAHAEFQTRQPEWREAIGSATSIVVPAHGVAEILPRVVDGLRALGIRPKRRPDAARIAAIRRLLAELAAQPVPQAPPLPPAGGWIERQPAASARPLGRLMRGIAADVARRPRPYALAAAAICGVILIAVLVKAVLPGGGGNGNSDEHAGAVAPASATTTPRPTNTSIPTVTPTVAAGKPTAAPKTPTSTQGTAVAAGAPPFGKADTFAMVAAPDCVAPGGRIEATWSAVDEEGGVDLIALFPAAAQNTEYRNYPWQYVYSVGGSAIFAAPEPPGPYEVRLVRNSIHLAASNPVTVSNDCPQ
jgi:hypothetical protein